MFHEKIVGTWPLKTESDPTMWLRRPFCLVVLWYLAGPKLSKFGAQELDAFATHKCQHVQFIPLSQSFQEANLDVPTICKTYVFGLRKGISLEKNGQRYGTVLVPSF